MCDIAIEVVGPRPGEKIHEELFNPDERPQPTPPRRSCVARRAPLDPEWVEEAFARVEDLVYGGDAAGLAALVAELAAERALEIRGSRSRARGRRRLPLYSSGQPCRWRSFRKSGPTRASPPWSGLRCSLRSTSRRRGT